MGAEMNRGGRHGVFAAGLARRALWNACGSRHLRTGIRLVEGQLRGSSDAKTAEQRGAFESKLSVVRRLILAFDVATLAAAGYWIGNMLGSARG